MERILQGAGPRGATLHQAWDPVPVTRADPKASSAREALSGVEAEQSSLRAREGMRVGASLFKGPVVGQETPLALLAEPCGNLGRWWLCARGAAPDGA